MSDYSTRFESLLKRVLNSLTCVGFRSISFNWGIAARFQARHVFLTVTFKGAAREGAEGDQAPPLAIRILIFIFLVFHQHCTVNRDRVDCKMFFGCTTGVATHSLSNQAVMNFRNLRNIKAAFFIAARFALTYITRTGCCRALPLWKQAWHLNYQQCRLMCSFYVTKLGPS